MRRGTFWLGPPLFMLALGLLPSIPTGQYGLLMNKQAGTGYLLDDQAKAQKLEGQNVRVIGTLDVAAKTIRVTDIQPA